MPRIPLTCIAALLPCLLPLAALAQCPSGPDDLLAGIELGYEDGAITVYTRNDAGLIIETVTYGDDAGWGYQTVSHYGYVLVSFATIENDVVQTDFLDLYSYPGQRLERFASVQSPNVSVSATLLTRYSGMSGFDDTGYKASITFTSKEPEAITWGGCSYSVIPIEVDEDEYGSLYYFVPEIGIGFYVDSLLNGVPDALPRPVSIRALPDTR